MNPEPADSSRRNEPDLHVSPEAPWLGLRSFSESVRGYFFGRDREIQEICERVLHRPLTVLFGQSGLGKTSILGAGVVPRLREMGWHPVRFRLVLDQGALPLETQVLAELCNTLGLVRPAAEVGLWAFFHDPLHGFIDEAGTSRFRPILIFDQFEELFTLGERHRPADVQDFLEALACVVENRPPTAVRDALDQDDALADRLLIGARPCKVLLSLREDYLHSLERSRAQMPSLMENRFELRLLAGPEAFEAVFRPGALRDEAGSSNPIIAPEAARSVVRFVAGVATDVPLGEIDNVPPLLSLVCEQLNARRLRDGAANIDAESLRHSASEVLGDFYDQSLEPFPPAVRHLLEDRLLSDSGFRESLTHDTAIADLRRMGLADPEAVLRKLVDCRLLVIEERAGVARIEFTHDVLAPIAAASRTERHVREAKIRAEQQLSEQRRKARRRAVLSLVLSVLAVVSILGSVIAWKQTRKAEAATKAAQQEVARNQELLRQASNAAFATGYKAWQEDWDAEKKGELAFSIGGFTKWHEAVAYLIRALELDPQNQRALSLLADTLRNRVRDKCPENTVEEMPLHFPSADCVHSPDRSRVLTVSTNIPLQIWDTISGKPVSEIIPDEGNFNKCFFSPDSRRLVTVHGSIVRIWDAITGRIVGEPLHLEGDFGTVTFSPDSRRLITNYDGIVRIWDAITAKNVGETLHLRVGDEVLTFSPDGRLLVASQNATSHIWDTTSGKAIDEPIRHHTFVSGVSFSPDGTRIAMRHVDGSVIIWDMKTRKTIGQPLLHEGFVYDVIFSPDSRYLVILNNRCADIWDTNSGKRVCEPIYHEPGVLRAKFSPDGTRVAIDSYDNAARIWDIATGVQMGEPLLHAGRINSIEFSPDATRVLTASEDKTARIWDAITGKPRGEILRHEGSVYSADFNSNATQITTYANDGISRIWEVARTGRPGEPHRHFLPVTSAAFSPDGAHLATASDHIARVWNAKAGQALEWLRHDGSIHSATFSPDGTQVITASGDTTARIWDAGSGKPIGEPLRHEGEVYSAAFSPDGSRVITASRDGTARIWDAVTGKQVGQVLRHQDEVNGAAFSPDGSYIITASNDKTAQLWNASTGMAIGKPYHHEDSVLSAAFSPDGVHVVTLSNDKSARIWNVSKGASVCEALLHGDKVTHAAFSPDGIHVVTSSSDKSARIWNLSNGARVGEILLHEEKVTHASFSPDGSRVVTSSTDNTARIWDVKTGKQLGEPLCHESWVRSASFSPDGTRVITASGNAAWLWNVRHPETTPSQAVLDWLKLINGLVVGEDGEMLMVPMGRRHSWTNFNHLPPGYWAEFGRWLGRKSSDRTLSVYSSRTLPEEAERERDSGSDEGLVRALELDPRLTLVRLKVLNTFNVSKPPSRFERLHHAWLRRYDLDLIPETNLTERLRAFELLASAGSASLVSVPSIRTNLPTKVMAIFWAESLLKEVSLGERDRIHLEDFVKQSSTNLLSGTEFERLRNLLGSD